MSSQLDTITRICKNAAGLVVAVQTLTVVSRTISTMDPSGSNLITADALSTRRFLRTASVNVDTEKFVVPDGDQDIDSVETSGSYDSYTVASSDVATVTYTGISPQNSITLGISGDTRVLGIGDTV